MLPHRRQLEPSRVHPCTVPVELVFFEPARVRCPSTIVVDNDFGSLFPIELGARSTQARMRRSSSATWGVVEVDLEQLVAYTAE